MTTHGFTGEVGSRAAPVVSSHPTVDSTDLELSLALWVDLADSADEFDLVLALQEAQEAPNPELRARALLSRGDPAAALDVLGGAAEPLPPLGASFTVRDLLSAACRAALGDGAANRWLLVTSGRVMGQRIGWYATHLVAITADLRGETQAADRSWGVLLGTFQVGTPHVQARNIAAHIAQRGDEPPPALIERLADSASALEQCGHSIAVDSRPTLAAVDSLVARGDVAGARLLLEYVIRRNGVGPALIARRETLEPHRQMRGYRALVVGIWLLLPLALLIPHVAGLALAIGAGWAFRRYVRIPGLSRSESTAWRAVRRVRPDPATGRPTEQYPDGGWIIAAVVVAAGISVFLGAAVSDLVAGLGGWAGTAAWVATPALCLALAYGLASRWSRRRQMRLLAEARGAATRRAVAGVGPCRCWDTQLLGDDHARAYARRHLLSTPVESRERPVREALGGAVHVLRCPSLGTPWLLASLPTEAAFLLMRGTAQAQQPPDDLPVGHYL